MHWSKLSYTLSGVKQNMLSIQCPLLKCQSKKKLFYFFLCDQLNFLARKCCSLSSCCISMGLSLHVSFCSDVPVPGVMYRPVDPALGIRQTHSRVPISVSFPELHDHWYECCLRVRGLLLFIIPPLRGSECKATRVTTQVELLSAHTCNRWDQE